MSDIRFDDVEGTWDGFAVGASPDTIDLSIKGLPRAPEDADKDVAGKEVLSYSSLAKFRDCPKQYENRYERHLRAVSDADALLFGSLVHKCLEEYFEKIRRIGGWSKSAHEIACDAYLAKIGEAMSVASNDAERMRAIKAAGMMNGYMERWSQEKDSFGAITNAQFCVITAEEEFIVPIRNPATGALSRTFCFAGKVDLVVEVNGKLYIGEHKTTSQVDAAYIDRIQMDFQSMLYANAIAMKHGKPVAGVIYDVLEKVKLRPKEGEGRDAFEKRLASYKTEKTLQKHRAAGPKPAETTEEFAERVEEAHRDPSKYHRIEVVFDPERLKIVETEVWLLTQQILASRKSRFGMNTSQCHAWYRQCDFLPACRKGALDHVTASQLENAIPHSELSLGRDLADATEDEPIF